MKKYRISEITSSSIPNGPGIYAWYADLHLPEKDTEEVINLLVNENSIEKKETVLKEFLERKLFSPFVETPYRVSLEGKLKPLYSGLIENKFKISDSLIENFIEDPNRLRGFQQVLKNLNTSFLSPIYIGMASNLKNRLSTHVKLINEYYNNLTPEMLQLNLTEEDFFQHKFALEAVVLRKIHPNKLFFNFMEIDFDNKLEIEIENILNRLNYPLCGRN